MPFVGWTSWPPFSKPLWSLICLFSCQCQCPHSTWKIFVQEKLLKMIFSERKLLTYVITFQSFHGSCTLEYLEMKLEGCTWSGSWELQTTHGNRVSSGDIPAYDPGAISLSVQCNIPKSATAPGSSVHHLVSLPQYLEVYMLGKIMIFEARTNLQFFYWTG